MSSNSARTRKFSLVVTKSSDNGCCREETSVKKLKTDSENGHFHAEENLKSEILAQTRIQAAFSREDIGDQEIEKYNESNVLGFLKQKSMIYAAQENTEGSPRTGDSGDWRGHQEKMEQQRAELFKKFKDRDHKISNVIIKQYKAEQMVEQPIDRRYSQHEILRCMSERETARETILAELEEKISIDAIEKHEAAREELLAAWQASRLEEAIQKQEIDRERILLKKNAHISNTVLHQHELAKERKLEKREFHQLHKDAILKLEAHREAIFDQCNEKFLSYAIRRYENAREMLLSEMEENSSDDSITTFDVDEGNKLVNENDGSI